MIVLRALAGALFLLGAWCLIAAATAGIGLAFRLPLVRTRALTGTALAASFWLGAGALVLFTQLWHLAAPIDGAALAAAGAIAAAGLGLHARSLVARVRQLDRRAWIAVACVLLAGLWAAHRATAATANFDTYMYHMPMVEWYRRYAHVPGIANLHGRFGFNDANFLLAALAESGPWFVSSTHLLNGVAVLGFLFHAAVRLGGAVGRGSPSIPAVFDAVLIVPTLAMVNDAGMFAGLTPGVPAAIALFAGFSLIAAALLRTPADARERDFALVAATTVLAAAAAIKLSVAAAAVPAWAIGMVRLWSSRGDDGRRPTAAVAAAFALSLGIGASWVIRGVVASGYPLYPNTVAGMAVPWRVPVEQARAEYDWIRLFARYSHDPARYNAGAWVEFVCTPTAWVMPWLKSLLHPARAWLVPVPLALAALFALLRVGVWRDRSTDVLWLVLPLAAGIGVWAHVAPRPEFGLWAFWLLAATLAARAAGRLWSRRAGVAGAAAAAVATVLPLLGAGLEAARQSDGNNYVAAASVWFVRPPPDGLLQPTRWDYPLTSYRTDAGLALAVPQGHRCGRAAPPCTSHPARNVALRRPGDLASGFIVRGAWMAERWPNPWARFLEDWRSVPPCRRPGP